MRVLFRFPYSLLFALILLSPLTATRSQEQIAGIIQEINGPVFWRKNKHVKGRGEKLDPRFDKARGLYVGEQIRAGRGGSVRLMLCSGQKDIPPPLTWVTVSISDECPNRAALAAYGRLGGSDRTGDTLIFSPALHSVVSPDRFVIHWIPSAAKCMFTWAIRDTQNKTIWEEDRIDGRSGSWDSNQARQVLKSYQSKDESVPLSLILTDDSCGNRKAIMFSLLSEKSEVALKKDLAQGDRNSGTLMAHLARAHVFESYRMFSEAAEEYEAALKIAPESRDLLKRTMLAHRETGNRIREEELKKHLESKPSSP